MTGGPSAISVVMLTFNRVDLALETIARLRALPDRFDLVVVDNGSTDGTAARVARAFPTVTLVQAGANLGAAGRNLGVARVRTPYVAFCDDDTWWHAGSLTRAARLLDAHAQVAVLSARVVVGNNNEADATCVLMSRSPLDPSGLPGPALIGFMACASVFRVSAFRETGGFDRRLFIGGEEELVALDVLARGHAIVYADELILHHHPSPLRDAGLRRRMLARNAAWIAWLRLPMKEAWRRTLVAAACMQREGTLARDGLSMLAALPWLLALRRPVPANVLQMLEKVHAAEARDMGSASPSQSTDP
jgi:GT2 family glycosyltransferase